jgi:L-2-hydroxyglutarate oxidase LhgO
MDRFDVCIIGAGVVGLAVARQLSQSAAYRHASIVLLEQESALGQHCSSRNSEVIHAGLYYPKDSYKARFCLRGKDLLYDYCRGREIAHRCTGKLVVAQAGEEPALAALQQRAEKNGVGDLQWLDSKALQALEPQLQASAALLSPSSGIIDSHELMLRLLQEAQQAGVIFAPHTRVAGIEASATGYQLQCRIGHGPDAEHYGFKTRAVVNCAGLWANDIARQLAGQVDQHPAVPTLHYCRGDYYSYHGQVRLKHLVYPLPEANTRGLGIHVTLDLAGQLRFGPDAHYRDDIDYGFAAQGGDHKALQFARAIERYLPNIKADELQPSYAGIRPKLAGPGEPAADFLLLSENGDAPGSAIHLLGIESPGLTACLALAEEVERRLGI